MLKEPILIRTLIELEGIATILDNVTDLDAAIALCGITQCEALGTITYEVVEGRTKWRLTMKPEAEAVRDRAKRLKKQASAMTRMKRGDNPPKPHTFKTTRSKRSTTLAQSFITDDEKDNYINYCELY